VCDAIERAKLGDPDTVDAKPRLVVADTRVLGRTGDLARRPREPRDVTTPRALYGTLPTLVGGLVLCEHDAKLEQTPVVVRRFLQRAP
jgi:hypothetical protein